MKRSRPFACLIFSVVVSFSPTFADQTGKALTSEQVFSRINSIETLSYQAKVRSPAGRILRTKIWIKGNKVRADAGWLKTGQIGKRGFQYSSNNWVVSPGLSINTVITFVKEAREAGDTRVIGKQTINGEDTTIIEYTRPRWDDFFNEIKVTLWISHKTLLPIKVIETNVTENKIQTTEVSAISFEEIDEKIFEDLLKADQQVKRRIKEKWRSWQEGREKVYPRFLRNDEDQRFTPERKVDLWQSFLSSVCKNNPYSTKDDEMRSHARSRMLFWMNKTSASATQSPPKSPGAGNKESGRDSTFIAYANGVVKDTATGLEWIAGLDVDTNWNDAQTWMQGLTADGGGWRMPTIEELKTLYKKGAGKSNMTPLFQTSGFSVWSGEKKDSLTAWKVDFFGGRTSCRVIPIDCNRCLFTRAFAVRSKHSQ